MHLLRVQGFYFALLQYSPIQTFTARFAPVHATNSQHSKTAHKALQWLFLRLHPFNRQRYQTYTSGYYTTCTTLERITAPQHLQHIPRYHHHARTLYRSTQPPIIIRYIRVQRRTPVMDPCQTVQHIADHASPAESAPAVCGSLASAAPGGAVQRQGRCGRRGTIDGYRRISFRAFAR